jgi:hypothetical protein
MMQSMQSVLQLMPLRKIILMIFLSHNSNDKPVVEPIAIKLRDIFGEDKVFYDSWSIRPGDGIIEKMNDGLTEPEYVFFFVSENSLKSPMVRLEWQTALHKATHGKCRLIPVRTGDVEMPALLMQNLYLDLYTNGVDAIAHQIVQIIQGMDSFSPAHESFSNLTFKLKEISSEKFEIEIFASHLQESVVDFVVSSLNSSEELDVNPVEGGMYRSAFQEGWMEFDGAVQVNGFKISIPGETISPSFPLLLRLTSKSEKSVSFYGLSHNKGTRGYHLIPGQKV